MCIRDRNYKDALILKNGGKLVKEFPHIPGIDFSGTVAESKNNNFKVGDKVILTGWRVGEIFYGGYSQYAKVNSDFLVKKPNSLTTKQTMMLGTAGFTALMCSFAIKAREELLLGEKVNDVIVTGASGFIGLNLLKKLSAYNASILVIDRNQPTEHIPRVEFEWADLRHLNKVYEADFLIHLAAITNSGYAEKYPLETYEVNVLGTVNLLNHVKIKERILFPSTALIYQASEIPLDEHSVMDVSATYAQSKFIGEQITEFRSKLMEVPYTIVRFFNIYGPLDAHPY